MEKTLSDFSKVLKTTLADTLEREQANEKKMGAKQAIAQFIEQYIMQHQDDFLKAVREKSKSFVSIPLSGLEPDLLSFACENEQDLGHFVHKYFADRDFLIYFSFWCKYSSRNGPSCTCSFPSS